jgi:hypothetical protein
MQAYDSVTCTIYVTFPRKSGDMNLTVKKNFGLGIQHSCQLLVEILHGRLEIEKQGSNKKGRAVSDPASLFVPSINQEERVKVSSRTSISIK